MSRADPYSPPTPEDRTPETEPETSMPTHTGTPHRLERAGLLT